MPDTPVARAMLGGGVFGMSLLHSMGVKFIYTRLEVPTAAAGTADGLVYVLKRTVAPMFLTAYLAFEIKAMYGASQGVKPWENESSWATKILDRIQYQTFEQAVMTLATVSALALTDLGELDLRLPVAHGLLFAAMRPVYAAGYLKDEGARLPGLLMGGFWANLGFLSYAAAVSLDAAKPSWSLLRNLYLAGNGLIGIALSVCLHSDDLK